jgi:hypothetical protein
VRSIHSFPATDVINTSLNGFRVFLVTHPLVPVMPFIESLSYLAYRFFDQGTPEIPSVNDKACSENPLLASIVSFALCIGVYLSDNYSERLAIMYYNNGNKYFSMSNSISPFRGVKAMTVLIWVS